MHLKMYVDNVTESACHFHSRKYDCS